MKINLKKLNLRYRKRITNRPFFAKVICDAAGHDFPINSIIICLNLSNTYCQYRAIMRGKTHTNAGDTWPSVDIFSAIPDGEDILQYSHTRRWVGVDDIEALSLESCSKEQIIEFLKTGKI